MGKNIDRESTLFTTIKTSIRCRKERKKKEFNLKTAFHRFVWGAGILFALIPLLASLLGIVLHNDNSELVERYKKFAGDFFYSGSFLWVSITVLVMSLLDLLLFGMRKTKTKKQEFIYKIIAVIATVLAAIGIYIYIDNIGNPISKYTMVAISVTAFVLFAVSSGIVSFKIMKEG